MVLTGAIIRAVRLQLRTAHVLCTHVMNSFADPADRGDG